MESAETRPPVPLLQTYKPAVVVAVLVILAVIGLSIRTASAPHAATVISQQTLEEQYGLGVNLIAVTAAGGMVDLRLHIVDAAKAKALLGDTANFPALRAPNGVVLPAAADVASQPITFEDGGNLFVLYANGANAVRPGDPVAILFGDLQVEAIESK